jgi:hypothetical protein
MNLLLRMRTMVSLSVLAVGFKRRLAPFLAASGRAGKMRA